MNELLDSLVDLIENDPETYENDWMKLFRLIELTRAAKKMLLILYGYLLIILKLFKRLFINFRRN